MWCNFYRRGSTGLRIERISDNRSTRWDTFFCRSRTSRGRCGNAEGYWSGWGCFSRERTDTTRSGRIRSSSQVNYDKLKNYLQSQQFFFILIYLWKVLFLFSLFFIFFDICVILVQVISGERFFLKEKFEMNFNH